MFLYLESKLTPNTITREKLALRIGITKKSLFNKLNGKTEFTLSEIKKIRDVVAPNESLEVLFQQTNNN